MGYFVQISNDVGVPIFQAAKNYQDLSFASTTLFHALVTASLKCGFVPSVLRAQELLLDLADARANLQSGDAALQALRNKIDSIEQENGRLVAHGKQKDVTVEASQRQAVAEYSRLQEELASQKLTMQSKVQSCEMDLQKSETRSQRCQEALATSESQAAELRRLTSDLQEQLRSTQTQHERLTSELQEQLRSTQQKVLAERDEGQRLERDAQERQVRSQVRHAEEAQKLQKECNSLEHAASKVREETRSMTASESAAMLKIELHWRTELAEVRETARSELRQQRFELDEDRRRSSQVKELTWRLETSNAELDKCKTALQTQRDCSQRSFVASQQQATLLQALMRSEEGMQKSADGLQRKLRQESGELSRCRKEMDELLQEVQDERCRSREGVRLAHQEVQEERCRSREGVLLAEEHVRRSQADAEAARAEAQRGAELVARMQAMVSEAKLSAKEDSDARLASISRHVQSELTQARREAAEATAAATVAQARAEALEREHKIKLTASETENQARLTALESRTQVKVEHLTGELARAKESLLRFEAQASVAVHKLEHAAGRQGKDSDELTQLRMEKTEQKALRLAEHQLELKAEERADKRLQEARICYEEKIASLTRKLSEGEATESRLKALIQSEVDVLQRYNRELDLQGQRLQDFGAEALQDIVASRMRGLADKVERRVLRGMRRSGDHWS
eukprot:TRINITY_DN3495_c0_g1_i15.p1 TRINITY_DN3495_c0_g1~~TRINITY_DN3495_c0_g1_i15.p1  ORF type:complete len:692 (-),score=209.15 TRINITY_DN3495_c0_g1_i15:366-2441(-)